MAPNGSMPAVNISGINSSSVYVNPFEPPTKRTSSDTDDAWAEEEDDMFREMGVLPEETAPKHKRTRVSQVRSSSSISRTVSFSM